MDVIASSSQGHTVQYSEKNPRAISQTLKASVSMLNVKGDDSPIRKIFGPMIWTCSGATEPGYLEVIESTMNSSVYQSILESNVRPSVQQLKLG